MKKKIALIERLGFEPSQGEISKHFSNIQLNILDVENLVQLELAYWRSIANQRREDMGLNQDIDSEKTVGEIEKIQWLGTNGQLLYLFDLLKDNGFIIQGQWERRFKILTYHFTNKNAEELKSRNLNQTNTNMLNNKKTPGKPKASESIEKIVKDIPKN